MIVIPHLEHHAVVSWGFILAAVVLTQVHVNMIQLQEANQVSRSLQMTQDRSKKTTLVRNKGESMSVNASVGNDGDGTNETYK